MANNFSIADLAGSKTCVSQTFVDLQKIIDCQTICVCSFITFPHGPNNATLAHAFFTSTFIDLFFRKEEKESSA